MNITKNSTSGNGTYISWTPPTATDNSGMVNLTSDFWPGEWFFIGTIKVTYTATDASGNTAVCCFSVTVLGMLNTGLKTKVIFLIDKTHTFVRVI